MRGIERVNQTMMGLKLILRGATLLRHHAWVNQTMMGLKPVDAFHGAAVLRAGESDHDGIET